MLMPSHLLYFFFCCCGRRRCCCCSVWRNRESRRGREKSLDKCCVCACVYVGKDKWYAFVICIVNRCSTPMFIWFVHCTALFVRVVVNRSVLSASQHQIGSLAIVWIFRFDLCRSSLSFSRAESVWEHLSIERKRILAHNICEGPQKRRERKWFT